MVATAYAVLIGIDHYDASDSLPNLRFAEKDCRDMFSVLTDRDIGTFDPSDVRMLLGHDASTQAIRETLGEMVIRVGVDDLLLVYFAGHGFMGPGDREGYIGTQDVSPDRLLHDPNAGLRMSSLRADVLERAAGTTVLILDCCHSGDLFEESSSHSDVNLLRAQIQSVLVRGSEGSALVACPPRGVSREDETLENGLLTHHVVRGLRRDAMEGPGMEVTFDSLVSYVKRSLPTQRPGNLGQSFGRIVLSRPGYGLDHPRSAESGTERGYRVASATACENPLSAVLPFIDELVSGLDRAGTREKTGRASPERRVAAVLGADEALLVWAGREQWRPYSEQIDRTVLRRWSPLLSDTVGVLYRTAVDAHRARAGDLLRITGGNGERLSVVVVAIGHPEADQYLLLLLVYEGEPPNHLTSDPALVAVGSALRALLAAEADPLAPVRIEDAILDDLKLTYGRVPLTLYNRRFELFGARLESLRVFFEPVVKLGPYQDDIRVQSWEALARDPAVDLAPLDLFRAAELWGRRFIIELDARMAEKALTAFAAARARAGWPAPGNLSVNVYPTSLLSSYYLGALRDSLVRNRIGRNTVVLEISEKQMIEPPDGEIWLDELSIFQDRLLKIREQLFVGFAIDDFGVGHGSLHRLARLAAAHVKVDREILHHPHAITEIELVLKVTNSLNVNSPVIVEGFDDGSPLGVRALYEAGVSEVQGYLVGRASPDLVDVSDAIRTTVSEAIRPAAHHPR
jgi:EAL domain-containing protein (putative c-di-GMP-specific phosphodiesterase class I)